MMFFEYMKVYNLKRTQELPITIEKAWDFFSTPKNLGKITPSHMGFKILYQSGGDTTYSGQIIRYRVSILPGVTVHWVTEITHVSEYKYFVDEQRFGPYALWHHQHWFEKIPGGVLMTDEVNYAIPFGLLGRLANWLFVERQVNAIFDHRFQILRDYFENHEK